MGLFIFHLLQIGMLVAGAASKLKEVTADSKSEFNTRSAGTLDSILRDWTPSVYEVFKRSEAPKPEVDTVISLHGRETRSVLKHSIPGSTQKPQRVASKHKHNARYKLKTKTLHARKKSQYLKPVHGAYPLVTGHAAKTLNISKLRKVIETTTKYPGVHTLYPSNKKSMAKHLPKTKKHTFKHLTQAKKHTIKRLPQTKKHKIKHVSAAKKRI